ncbi:hypothetical protein ABH923_002305 [Leifsonia sp. EB41]|uniref:hypothetical protein n=1 Tax=Leifsonia sp. EB41 TaxID=3156260 RepID=UPI003517BAE4
MTPAEAAALLGLPENATEAQIGEAYAAHIATVPERDIAAVDALARARDALLAGVRWQPPQSAGAPQDWGRPQGGTTPIGLGTQPGGGVPPTPPAGAPQGGFMPPTPNTNQPAYAPQPTPAPQGAPRHAAYPPPQPGFHSQTAPAPQYTTPQQPAYQQPYPGYPQAPAHPRKPLSNGAIIGIALGSTALLLVVLLVAVIALTGNAQRSLAGASQNGSAAAPSTVPSSGDPSAADQSYVIDGVTIQPEQGWTFLLTSQRDCPAAEVIVGFADTVDGDSIDQHTDTVSLKAGVPYTYTVPDTASTHQYAGIDDLQCIPT